MNINTPTFQLPRDWTAEQAEFLSTVLEDLTQAVWEAYEDDLMRLWRDRDGLSFPCDNQLDLQLQQPLIPPADPALGCGGDEDIPW
jgi:hypothetical protein